MANSKEEKLRQKFEALKRKEEEQATQIISQKYGLPYADLTVFPVEIDAIVLIPEDKAKYGELAVIQKTGKDLKIAVKSPDKPETKTLLSRLEKDGFKYELFKVSGSSLKRAWSFYATVPEKYATEAGTLEIRGGTLFAFREEIKSFEDIKNLVWKRFDARTTEILEVILAGALAVEASDVHLEPQRDEARLRMRVDGVLRDIIPLPKKVYRLLLSRIKLVSELKLNITQKAQDGRFTIKVGDYEIEVRVSTLPGPDGENIVLRILDPKTLDITFERLGMQPWVTAAMEKELKRPNGMILTTGPTGSGKTTTLYASLKKLYNPGVKVITLEDPIEYHIKGIEQTQVDPEKGYDFANGLRSIVRQDPDIIMVGEIRDFETAETAANAALTGHLVLSTLHTNDAAGTIPRLIDLGVKPAIIAPAINVSMAQRLVRKLCPECKTKSRLNTAQKQKTERELKEFPKGVKVPPTREWKIFKASARGCPACSNLGYKGRIGIYEIILVDESFGKLILKEPSEFEIKKLAKDQGQITMGQDGLLKVLAGITDFAELERVVGAG